MEKGDILSVSGPGRGKSQRGGDLPLPQEPHIAKSGNRPNSFWFVCAQHLFELFITSDPLVETIIPKKFMYTYSRLQVRIGIRNCKVCNNLDPIKLTKFLSHISPKCNIPQLWVALTKNPDFQSECQVFFSVKEMTSLQNCYYLHYQIVLRIPQYSSVSTLYVDLGFEQA